MMGEPKKPVSRGVNTAVSLEVQGSPKTKGGRKKKRQVTQGFHLRYSAKRQDRGQGRANLFW